MRLDKWLKVSRLIKRRTVANEACDNGRVTANGRSVKASYEVKPGDVLELKFGERTVKVEVLAVGHHGSRYSTGRELLEQICPETALISVGKHNGYGHPDPGTVERLLAAGAEGYRTDLHGTVTVRRNET